MNEILDNRIKGRKITDLNEIKQIEINILDQIVSVCEKYNLKYILAYGTLLGAIRHNGFIPWDDDIDIIMPRNDYNKLIEIWKDDKYILVECMKNKDYIYPFAKVYDNDTILEETIVDNSTKLGIYVDIFPCDAIKGTKEESIKFFKKCELVEKMRLYSVNPYEKILNKDKKKNLGRKFIWVCLRKIGPARFSRYFTKIVQKYEFNDVSYVGCICNRHYEKQIVPKELFEELIDVKFENKLYKAPKNYDLMLTRIYGDYMKLPPIEERHLAHAFNAWKCDRN